MFESISGRCSYCAVRVAGAAEALAASPVALVVFFEMQLAMLQRWQFFFDLRLSFTQITFEL
jgi:hypothetical protein